MRMLAFGLAALMSLAGLGTVAASTANSTQDADNVYVVSLKGLS